jgi:hypothetical protein
MEELPEEVGRVGVGMSARGSFNARVEPDENADQVWDDDVWQKWKVCVF